MNDRYRGFSWRRTNAPVSSTRTDDICFLDDHTGWAVNTNGQILLTEDGGDHWTLQASLPNTWLRCVGFANRQLGWVGSVGGKDDSGTPVAAERLLMTRDGGESWQMVTALPPGAPPRICGLSVVDAHTVYVAGSNEPTDPSAVVKTHDGGATWTAIPMEQHASLLVDICFISADEGWVVGGKHPADAGTANHRDAVIPVVLHTKDGGETWTDLTTDPALLAQFPEGEWGWKLQYLPPNHLFVSLENFKAGAILRSDDRGQTWQRLVINDAQGNINLEGVGFLDPDTGWVGGWGSGDLKAGFTSRTSDGGKTWVNADDTGYRLNRFRFIGDPVRVAFASGDTVYKFTDAPPPIPLDPLAIVSERDGVALQVTVPPGTKELVIDARDRFGRLAFPVMRETAPLPGRQQLPLRFPATAPWPFIVRVTIDGRAESILAAAPAPAPPPVQVSSSSSGAPGSTAPLSFATDIKPLFRPMDQQAMAKLDLDLWNEAQVRAAAPDILSRLRAGTMPCDAAWPAEKVALFARWAAQVKTG